MTPEDKAAFEAAAKSRGEYITKSKGSLTLEWLWAFQTALAHRDAQASAINEKMLEALNTAADVAEFLAKQLNTDDMWTHVSVLKEAIAAAEAHKTMESNKQ